MIEEIRELSRDLNGRVRMKTDGDFGPLSQEFRRFAHGVDEGSLRERWDLIQRHALIVIVLCKHPTANRSPSDSWHPTSSTQCFSATTPGFIQR